MKAREKEMHQSYEQYVNALVTDAAETVPAVSDELLAWMDHAPALATVVLRARGPTFTSLAYSGSPSHEQADLLIRRDLNPFSSPYQVPFAVIAGAPEERYEAAGRCLRQLLEANGVGAGPSSRSLLTCWPTAVVLCPPVGPAPMWVANLFASAAEKANLSLDGELEAIREFGTDIHSRVARDIEEESRDTSAHRACCEGYPTSVCIAAAAPSSTWRRPWRTARRRRTSRTCSNRRAMEVI